GGTSNGARDARMRQLIEAHILQASTQRTAPIIVEANGQDGAHQDGAHQDNARQDGANVVAVAPATPNAEPPPAERADAAAASAKADPVPVPRPRLQAANLPAGASRQAASTQAHATRAQRTTAKASTLACCKTSQLCVKRVTSNATSGRLLPCTEPTFVRRRSGKIGGDQA